MRRPCVNVDNSVLSTIDLRIVCQFDFVIADMDMTHTVQISTRTVVCVYVYVYIIIYIAMYACIYIYNIHIVCDIQPCSRCLRSVHDTAIIQKAVRPRRVHGGWGW